jgi:PIN domain nuclease of toxin-antitoxin system
VRLLLDTHIWLWTFLQPERIPAAILKVLQAPDSELWLSPVSVWELTMLTRKQRIGLTQDVPEWVEESLAKLPMRQAVLTYEIALATQDVDLGDHHDPADRFLAATAKVLDLTLVTVDARLLAGKGYSVLK